MLGLFLLGEPPVLPPDSVEALWEAWQTAGRAVWVDTAKAEDLLAFPLFSEADVRAILVAREGGPFRSFEDFFARTGLNPALLPFLSSWLHLRPRDNLFLNVTASTAGSPRVNLRRNSRRWSLWMEYRHADTSFRTVMATTWAHVGTFRPVTGWTGPFPRSLWSSLWMPDEALLSTRLDTLWRVWLHPRLGMGTFHLLWPDSILGFTRGEGLHIWMRATGDGWLGFRTRLLGVEVYPGSTLTWAVVGFLPGDRLRWAWRWAVATGEGEARVHLRFPSWGFRLRWLAGRTVQIRGRGYVRLGQTRLYAGAWENGGWVRVVRSPWSWKWGYYTGAHRVEIRFWGRTGFFRAGVVSDTTHLWWMHMPWQVSSGYAEGGWRFHRNGWSGELRGLVSAGQPPRVGVGGTLRWHGFVSW